MLVYYPGSFIEDFLILLSPAILVGEPDNEIIVREVNEVKIRGFPDLA